MFGTITIIIVPFYTLDAFVAFLVALTVLLTFRVIVASLPQLSVIYRSFSQNGTPDVQLELLFRIFEPGASAEREAQKPVREQVAKLERVWQQKAAQELDVQRQTKKLDRAISLALKIHGYSDTGRQWKALPENTRKTIEDFNRLPKEKQSMALTKMREDLKLHPDKVEKLVQQLELGRGMGRGRGGDLLAANRLH